MTNEQNQLKYSWQISIFEWSHLGILSIDSNKKKALYLRVNVFSTNVLIGETIFTSPTGDGTSILRGRSSPAKV